MRHAAARTTVGAFSRLLWTSRYLHPCLALESALAIAAQQGPPDHQLPMPGLPPPPGALSTPPVTGLPPPPMLAPPAGAMAPMAGVQDVLIHQRRIA